MKTAWRLPSLLSFFSVIVDSNIFFFAQNSSANGCRWRWWSTGRLTTHTHTHTSHHIYSLETGGKEYKRGWKLFFTIVNVNIYMQKVFGCTTTSWKSSVGVWLVAIHPLQPNDQVLKTGISFDSFTSFISNGVIHITHNIKSFDNWQMNMKQQFINLIKRRRQKRKKERKISIEDGYERKK